jgi:hypothetical protein
MDQRTCTPKQCPPTDETERVRVNCRGLSDSEVGVAIEWAENRKRAARVGARELT